MERGWIATTAGALDIVAGVAGLIGCVALFFAGTIVGNIPEAAEEFPLPIVAAFLGFLGVLVLVLAVLALVGGVASLNRKRWGWALTGAIAAAFICPPLGIPAIILTAIAQDHARSAAAG